MRKTREHTKKNWEQQKAEETGNEAKLGPKSSPKKRSVEKEQEDQAPSNGKRRRRRLKHSLIK